ncbi:MAG: hypothetical protein HY360_20690 [Verrucomicrobia bacterium]|nr:hypothetical protein [Verrucomicrobiota bacterium]
MRVKVLPDSRQADISLRMNPAYLLRRVILEDRWESQLAELVALCRRVGIEDVLLMEQSHQLLMTPYPLDKHRRMAAIYVKMAEELRRHGIIFSVNLATLVGHADAKVDAAMTLPFQKFVGENLREAHACCCILDDAWQDYAAMVCAFYAAAKPDKMYIDDDFRSLNHHTMFGCFCPIHAARTAEAAGIALTPERLLQHVCGPSGQDQQVRSAWMRINFQGQLQAARKMRLAAEQVSPATRLGLMNSGEPAHSVQGRDMVALLREFSGPNRRPLSRPAGGAYSDAIHDGIFVSHQTMALSVREAGTDAQITSEVENWPHTRFTKGLRSTRLQMELHALAGAEGFTLNLYDYLATPFAQEPAFERLLVEIKERLRRIQEAREGKVAKGFGLPWRKDFAEFHFSRRANIADLMPDRRLDCLLAQFGLPTQFASACGNAILGDDVQAYSDQDMDAFLCGGLMLDAPAVEHLCRRGYGNLLGCRVAGTLPRAAAERLAAHDFCGSFAGNNLLTNWFRLEPQGKFVARLELMPGAVSVSTLLDLEMRELAPGTVLFENARGGRVAVFAAPLDAWSWLHRGRAYLAGKIVNWLMRDQLPLWIEDCPNVGPFYYENSQNGEGLLGIVNGSLDPVRLNVHTGLKFTELFTGKPADPDHMVLEGLGLHFYLTTRS